jgi:prepilin-type N-terminal cleavage/methylation domain-containing protein
MRQSSRAFTLIELLIVVGIITILSAIALPNFLEAQVRAKVARVKTDLRTISIAWESYMVDNNRYPVDWDNNYQAGEWMQRGMIMVTTPIAYLSTFPVDVFSAMKNPNSNEYQPYFEVASCASAYCMYSLGPNVIEEFEGNDEWPDGIIDSKPGMIGEPYRGAIDMRPYDPTNGVVSDGDVHRLGGDYRRGNWTIWGVDFRKWGTMPE